MSERDIVATIKVAVGGALAFTLGEYTDEVDAAVERGAKLAAESILSEGERIEGWTLPDIVALAMAAKHLGACDHPGCLRCRASKNVVGIALKRIHGTEDEGK